MTARNPVYFRPFDFMASLADTPQELLPRLTRVYAVGDSLFANEYGGAVLNTNLAENPPRMNNNNLPRRLYDAVCAAPATWRRMDHQDWTWEAPTKWAAVNTSAEWEPPHSAGYSRYHMSSHANTYAEITVPDGAENFALVMHADQGRGTVDVTLNSGSIAAYGPPEIDTARTRLHASDIGNPYKITEYHGLPAGPNVIRVTKRNDYKDVYLWGCAWWSGATVAVFNVAHGGHTLKDYENQHLQAEVMEAAPHAVVFQPMIMNEISPNTGAGHSVAETLADLDSFLDALGDVDILCVTPPAWGTNPQNPSVNYYAAFTNPDMETVNDAVVARIVERGLPCVDGFTLAKRRLGHQGATLLSGAAGSATTDGQHPVDGSEWARDAFKFVPRIG